MPTDDERRAVARMLRRSRSEWSGMGWRLWLGPKFCAVVLSDGNRDELEDAAHRLADLIEPDTTTDTTKNAQDTTKCDREALLELADEIERKADEALDESAHSISEAVATSKLNEYTVRNGIAQRIRKALGVCDG